MKILHLGSHNGNIGDNASHIGFRKIIEDIVSEDTVIDKLEIRKFYNNYSLPDRLFFDSKFTARVNKYDLLVVGGGGFLDYWVENSVTGTTLNISKEVFDLIKVPVMITSVGCMPHKEVPEGNVEKFRNFLDYLLSRKNTLIAVRNDGSKETLKQFIGEQYAAAIPEVLDHGFFYENDGTFYKPFEEKYILINTTSDQVLMKNRSIGKIDGERHIIEMSKAINNIIHNSELNIVFAPHIYSDYQAIDGILKHINDYHIRSRIAITPFAQGDFGCNQIYSAYKNSAVVAGMRFHANVCSIAMNVPSIGLAALDRVQNMYDSLGLHNSVVKVDRPFSVELTGLIQAKLKPHNQPVYTDVDRRKKETKELYTLFLNGLV